MSARTAAWLAWSLAALSVAMFVASVALYVLARAAPVPSSWGANLTVSGLLVFVPFLAFPLVGALVASKRPENPIGWICLAVGLVWMFIGLSDYYSFYGLARSGAVPFPVAIGTLSNQWLWVPALGLAGTYLLLLFPDGRLPSRRWRPLAWLSGVMIVLLSVAILLAPGPLAGLEGVRNPFGLEGVPWVTNAAYIVLPLLPLCILASAVSLVLRYRRSRGEEREQIKWIAFAASVVGLLYLIAMVTSAIFPSEAWFAAGSPLWLDLLSYAALLSFPAVPIAVGFAGNQDSRNASNSSSCSHHWSACSSSSGGWSGRPGNSGPPSGSNNPSESVCLRGTATDGVRFLRSRNSLTKLQQVPRRV
jgi:hypothetical protein